MRRLQPYRLVIVTGMMMAIVLASDSSNHVNAADPVVTATAATAANQIADDGKLRIICFGAHPDDCELRAAGVAAKWTAQGHHVKFVSVTNGDVGHWNIAGGNRMFEISERDLILGLYPFGNFLGFANILFQPAVGIRYLRSVIVINVIDASRIRVCHLRNGWCGEQSEQNNAELQSNRWISIIRSCKPTWTHA